MGLAILGHFILIPLLMGSIPIGTAAGFDSFWMGFFFVFVPWCFGPLPRGRRKFFENPSLTEGDKVYLLLMALVMLFIGSFIGSLVFYPQQVVVYG